MDAAYELFVALEAALRVFFLIFLRVGAAIAVLPVFGERSIPARIRLGIAFAFSFLIFSSVASKFEILLLLEFIYWKVLIAEILIGLIFGLAIRFFIFVLQITGTIAAQSTSLSQIFGTAAMEPLPAMGHLMVVGGLALATIWGLHIEFALSLILTYEIFPPGVFPLPNLVADFGVYRVSETFFLAFTLSAPFLIASFIYNLTLGVINKAMPLLMVAFVGAPAITLGGLIVLFLSMIPLLSVWNNEFQSFVVNPFRMR